MNENKLGICIAMGICMAIILTLIVSATTSKPIGEQDIETPCNTWVNGHINYCEPTPQLIPESCHDFTGDEQKMCIGDEFYNARVAHENDSGFNSGTN